MSQHMWQRLAGWLVVSLGALIVLAARLPSVILEAGKPFPYDLFAPPVLARAPLAGFADIRTRLSPTYSRYPDKPAATGRVSRQFYMRASVLYCDLCDSGPVEQQTMRRRDRYG